MVEVLQKLYEVNVVGVVDWLPRVRIGWLKHKGSNTISPVRLSKPGYLKSVVRRFGTESCKPVSTPMPEFFLESNVRWRFPDRFRCTDIPWKLDSLLYYTLRTRPDISSSVMIFSRFQNLTTNYCHQAVKRFLRYLELTPKVGTNFLQTGLTINGYVDAYFAGDKNDWRYMFGYLINVGGAVCLWLSKKQALLYPRVKLDTMLLLRLRKKFCRSKGS